MPWLGLVRVACVLAAGLPSFMSAHAFVQMAHVRDNATLAQTPGHADLATTRDGFYRPGDGGRAVYIWRPDPCRTPDNGVEVANKSPSGGCWIADLSGIKPTPMLWGAAGDGQTDDTASVQAAIDALRGGTLYLGRHLYNIRSPLTAAGTIAIVGEAGGRGQADTTCDSGLLYGAADFNLLTLQGAHSKLERTCIGTAAGIANTNNSAITVGGTAYNVVLEANQINRACIGVDISTTAASRQAAMETIVRDNVVVPANRSNCSAIRIGAGSQNAKSGDLHVLDNTIVCSPRGGPAIGILIHDSGGSYFTNNEIYGCGTGTKLYPGSDQKIVWLYFTNTVLGDTSTTNDLLIDTASAKGVINGINFVGSWASNSQNGPSVLIRNTAGGFIYGLRFVGHRTYSFHQQGGFSITAGTDIALTASVVCTTRGAADTVGVSIGGTAAQITLRDNRIGGCDALMPSTYATGIKVATSAAIVGMILNNDLLNTVTPIEWAPRHPNPTVQIANNLGIDNVSGRVAAAEAVTLPLSPVVRVTGTATITAMHPAWPNRRVTLIPQSRLSFSTAGGNICNNVTAPARAPVDAVWLADNNCWSVK